MDNPFGDGCDQDVENWEIGQFLPPNVWEQAKELRKDCPVLSEHDARVVSEYRRLNLEWINERNAK